MGVGNNEPIVVHTDSQGAIDLLHKESDSKQARHLNIRLFRLRDLMNSKLIEVKYLPTDRMPADALTKQLHRAAFERHIKVLTAD